jgi:hypothetical protein
MHYLTALAKRHPLVQTIPAWMIGYWISKSLVTRLLNTFVAILEGAGIDSNCMPHFREAHVRKTPLFVCYIFVRNIWKYYL